MELYHNDMSVCSQKVRVTLAEKGLEATKHHLDLGAGDSHTPEYLALNPKGVVPTLIDNDKVIIESTVICEYLDDAYPDIPLRPTDPYELSQMRHWTLVPDAGLHLWCSTVSFALAWRHQDRTEQMKKWNAQVRAERMAAIELGLDAPLVAPHLNNYVDVLYKMAKALKGREWLVGNAYSLADIAMLPYVCRLDDMEQQWIWQDNPALAPLTEWLARCRARPSYIAITAHNNPEIIANMYKFGQPEIPNVAKLITAR